MTLTSHHQLVALAGRVAKPARQTIVQHPHLPYHGKIAQLDAAGDWRGNARLLGCLPERQMADLLYAADAVILPFRAGSGSWNTSAVAVRDQGSLMITTSPEKRGYVATENAFYAPPGDVDAMRSGLTA